MVDFPERRTRRTTRLRDYDYSWPGAYFVTAVTFQRAFLFEKVAAQHIVETAWASLPKQFPNLDVDQFVVMPNHIHGILVIQPDAVTAGTNLETSISLPDGQSRSYMRLAAAMNYFKSSAARHLNALRGMPSVPVWQRGYYEHVIRGEADLERVREHIAYNPLKWQEDEYNPGRSGAGNKP